MQLGKLEEIEKNQSLSCETERDRPETGQRDRSELYSQGRSRIFKNCKITYPARPPGRLEAALIRAGRIRPGIKTYASRRLPKRPAPT